MLFGAKLHRWLVVFAYLFGHPISGEDIPEKVELMSTLEAYQQNCKGLAPFDFKLRLVVTDHFRDDVRPVQTADGRFQFDAEGERLRWVIKTVDESVEKQEPVFYAVNIAGKIGHAVSTNGNIPMIQTYNSFESAVQDSNVSLPWFWGIIKHPFGDNHDAELKRILKIVVSDNTSVSVNQSETEVSLQAKQVHEEGLRFDTYSWRFSLPNLVPQGTTLRRALNGKDVVYYDVKLSWEEVNSHLVPSYIFASTGRLIESEGRTVLGHREHDTEIAWISVHKPLEFDHDFSIASVEHLIEFLEVDQ